MSAPNTIVVVSPGPEMAKPGSLTTSIYMPLLSSTRFVEVFKFHHDVLSMVRRAGNNKIDFHVKQLLADHVLRHLDFRKIKLSGDDFNSDLMILCQTFAPKAAKDQEDLVKSHPFIPPSKAGQGMATDALLLLIEEFEDLCKCLKIPEPTASHMLLSMVVSGDPYKRLKAEAKRDNKISSMEEN